MNVELVEKSSVSWREETKWAPIIAQLVNGKALKLTLDKPDKCIHAKIRQAAGVQGKSVRIKIDKANPCIIYVTLKDEE